MKDERSLSEVANSFMITEVAGGMHGKLLEYLNKTVKKMVDYHKSRGQSLSKTTILELVRNEHYEHLFAIQAAKNGNVSKGSVRVQKEDMGGTKLCFKNAMEYVKKNGGEVAFGIGIDPPDYDRFFKITDDQKAMRTKLFGTTHAFVVKDGKVIDPTWGKDNAWYFYGIVPKSTWKKMTPSQLQTWIYRTIKKAPIPKLLY